jgi:CheY-like chemotaxis protein
MNNQTAIQKITHLMKLNGVEKRKQASLLAEILNIKYNSAKQKLDEKRGITYDEVQKTLYYFNANNKQTRTHNGVMIKGNIHIRCNVDVDEPVSQIDNSSDKYTTKRNNLYILDSSDNNHDSEYYKVKALEIVPSPKLAILDNEMDILDLLQSLCLEYGIHSYIFQNKQDLLLSLKSNKYDCFLLDWLLDFEDTSEDLIKTLRKEKISSPIIILTGQIEKHEKQIGESIANYQVELIQKPTRPHIVMSTLVNKMFLSER